MRWMSLVNVEQKSGWQVNFDDGKMFFWMETMCDWWKMMICEAAVLGREGGGRREQVRPRTPPQQGRKETAGFGAATNQAGRRPGGVCFLLTPFACSHSCWFQPKIQTKWMFKSINVNNSMRIGPAGGRGRPGRFALGGGWGKNWMTLVNPSSPSLPIHFKTHWKWFSNDN